LARLVVPNVSETTEMPAKVDALERAERFGDTPSVDRVGWRVEPAPTDLERRYFGQIVALLLSLVPAIAAVWTANHIAELVDPLVQAAVAPLVPFLARFPSLVREVLGGRYGLFTMGPLLFVWAVPTIVFYAPFLGAY
jgi:ferrous iron transport protein B